MAFRVPDIPGSRKFWYGGVPFLVICGLGVWCWFAWRAEVLRGQNSGNNARLNKIYREFHPIKVINPRLPIVNAPFIHAKDVKKQVRKHDMVIGVLVGGEARAYPLNMLTGPSREIINDTLGGRAIAATW